MQEALTYDDVLLLPQYSDIRSRSEVDISTDLGNGLTLGLPIFSSPMDTISENFMARAISEEGGSAIIHRYNSIEQQSKMVGDAFCGGALNVGAAVGVSGDFVDRVHAALEQGCRLICVDVAHGHHVMMKDALETLRQTFGAVSYTHLTLPTILRV